MQELISYLNNSPTAFHAIKNVEDKLKKNNFEKLNEATNWELVPGKSYYVIRNTSSIIAFKIPTSVGNGFHIVASHSDSPSFKLKPNSSIVDMRNNFSKVNTEPYGGMITYSWMDRPLGVAGRIFVEDEEAIIEELVNFKETLVIPSVAIHLNRSGEWKPNPQVDLLPLLGDGSKSFNDLLKEYANNKNVLASDLFLYNKEEGTTYGTNNEYILSGRLDDLECAYTSMEALIKSDPKVIAVSCVFNNEEVGSRSNNGADSTFLSDTLKRISESLKVNMECMLANSFMVSSDNAHGVHPNHPELSDPTNMVYLNKGVVIKHQAGLNYTTDGYSEAVFKKICKLANVPYQDYTNRSDQRGGGTLGAISLSHVSVPSVDIGLAQLSMHSTLETAGTTDVEYMINALQKYFEVELNKENNTVIVK